MKVRFVHNLFLKRFPGYLYYCEPNASSATSALQSSFTPSNSEFVYSRGGILTPEQRHFYEENGFLVIKKLVSEDKIDVYRERFQKICDGEIYVPGMTVMKDVSVAKTHAHDKGEKFVNKIQSFENDDVLFQYCRLPEVLQYIQSFIGPDCMAMHTMVINKPPDPGTKTSRHPMHQDLHYFPFRPAHKIVCAWTAMQKVTRDNGCLVVIPGTHKGELAEHAYPDWEVMYDLNFEACGCQQFRFWCEAAAVRDTYLFYNTLQGGVNKAYHGVKSYNPDMERLWVEVEEGDTVFFHPLLLHGSGSNKTQNFRKSISCHYAASDCEYIDVKGTTQELIANEVHDIIAKKLGKDVAEHIDFRDVWRYRARLVCGNEGTLSVGNY
ncbi:hypothetical protein LSH36_551g00013 [Paralvinella palmiformis]|uniref:phytanoyl-CoA dioxygenase n=1 Tax=Paralvinella palmiformis TaxID=53620 RepID=A0AAD9J6W7_9ANNE|nr:hypothetical protein LSH36_551g00013 [Paralvinella palmiformis]